MSNSAITIERGDIKLMSEETLRDEYKRLYRELVEDEDTEVLEVYVEKHLTEQGTAVGVMSLTVVFYNDKYLDLTKGVMQ